MSPVDGAGGFKGKQIPVEGLEVGKREGVAKGSNSAPLQAAGGGGDGPEDGADNGGNKVPGFWHMKKGPVQVPGLGKRKPPVSPLRRKPGKKDN